MSEMKVIFSEPKEILEFVHKVEKYPYTMDMKRGKFIIDAKSILGIMNMGLCNEIELLVYADDCEELKQDISQYIAA